jgi:hypothetical protein
MIKYKLKINLQDEREFHSDMVFTTGDTNAYQLHIDFVDNGQPYDVNNHILTVKAKRSDGQIIIGGNTVTGNTAVYTLPNNMYAAPGELRLEIALTDPSDGYVTTKEVIADVREGFGDEGVSADDNYPILVTLITSVNSAVTAATAAASYATKKGDELEQRAQNGDFNGAVGEQGPQGPQGIQGAPYNQTVITVDFAPGSDSGLDLNTLETVAGGILSVTAGASFSMETPIRYVDGPKHAQVLVYLKTTAAITIRWADAFNFVNNEVPPIASGQAYRIIMEYNYALAKWVVGTIHDGAVS